MSEATFENPDIEEVETDLLIIGGGMASCGTAYEAKRWAPEGTRITMVDKAAVDRSGAVAQGLSAINTYIGENTPEDYVRMVHAYLMGITRDDLVFDVGRHVDDTVHLFEEWGLPIWKSKETEGVALADGGVPVRSGRWQIMINGESYKPIVAEAAKAAIGDGNLYERVFISHLLTDPNDPNTIAGAVGFSVRDNVVYVFKAKAVICSAGGAVNLWRPHAVGEGLGRAWYTVFNTGSVYALMLQVGAEMSQMEHRIVQTRFKDGYGPVGMYFLMFHSKASNAYGEEYEQTRKHELEGWQPYAGAAPMPR